MTRTKTQQHEGEIMRDQQQNKVWNPGGSKSLRFVAIALPQKSDRPHRQGSMIFFSTSRV